MNTSNAVPDGRPGIHVVEAECERLYELAISAKDRHPRSAAMLLAELDRAVVCDAGRLPPQTVSMESRIEFVDEGSGTRRVVQLVYPHEADIAAGRISILTPVGAGLIGMIAGSSIEWPDRDGHVRTLRIVSVEEPTEA